MSKFIISGFADEIDPYLNTQMDVLDPASVTSRSAAPTPKISPW